MQLINNIYSSNLEVKIKMTNLNAIITPKYFAMQLSNGQVL